MIPNISFKSEVIAAEVFPRERFDLEKDLLIIDNNVLENNPHIAEGWKSVYRVAGGEALKDLAQFSVHIEEIFQAWSEPLSRQSRIVACGGGSVGDFAGFVASVLKRGVVFEQVPSTWLAAIDSAHGGKTALNVRGTKNQLGTFYPARAVILCEDILKSQPKERAVDGLGELIKIALIDKGDLFERVAEQAAAPAAELLWRYLRPAVEIKYQIVEQDPYETLGARKVLNFGHTLGHVIESFYQRSHGDSVAQGLWFALEWSHHKGWLSSEEYKRVSTVLKKMKLEPLTSDSQFIPMDYKTTLELLLQDKKIGADAKIDFVFLRTIGEPVRQPVHSEEILVEALRQGWVRG